LRPRGTHTKRRAVDSTRHHGREKWSCAKRNLLRARSALGVVTEDHPQMASRSLRQCTASAQSTRHPAKSSRNASPHSLVFAWALSCGRLWKSSHARARKRLRARAAYMSPSRPTRPPLTHPDTHIQAQHPMQDPVQKLRLLVARGGASPRREQPCHLAERFLESHLGREGHQK